MATCRGLGPGDWDLQRLILAIIVLLAAAVGPETEACGAGLPRSCLLIQTSAIPCRYPRRRPGCW